MKKYILVPGCLTFLLIFISTVFCNAVAIQFMTLDDNIFKRQFQFKVEGVPYTTNKSGYAEISLPINKPNFSVTLEDDTFKVVYPRKNIFIPLDQNAVIEIIAGKINDFKIYNTLQAGLDKLDRKIKAADISCDEMKNTINELVKQSQDSIDLRQKRDSVYPIITPLFNKHVLNLLNLGNAYKRLVKSKNYRDSVLIKNVNDKMIAYNATFDSLFIMQDNIKKWINDYWRNDDLQNDLNSILTDCLDKHKEKLENIRETIRDIDALNHTQKPSEQDKLRVQIKLEGIIDAMFTSEEILAAKIKILNTRLLN